METLPHVGERVIIDFGGHDKEGVVVHISRTLTPASVTVEFWLTGADEPTRITYPANWVRRVQPV